MVSRVVNVPIRIVPSHCGLPPIWWLKSLPPPPPNLYPLPNPRKAILHWRYASGRSRLHRFFFCSCTCLKVLFTDIMLKCRFRSKSKNHFNFFAPNKCRFLFKPIIFVYSCKQSESLWHGLFTVHNICEMAAYFNLSNNEISKELLVNKFNMILDNQSRLALNNKKIPLPDEPQKCLGFVHKQLAEVFCKRRCS